MSHLKRTRKEWRGAIIGMVMGDGSLYQQRYRDGRRDGNYIMDISHSLRQYSYLRQKKEIVNQIFEYDVPIKERVVKSSNGKSYKAVRMQTRVHPRLSFIAKNIYIDRIKRITPWALENITTEGMAYWWFDDGHLKRDKRLNHGGGEAIFGVYGYTLDEINFLANFLVEKFDVHFRVHRHKKSGGYYLSRGLSEAAKFLEKIKDFACPSMKYKVDYKGAFKRDLYNLNYC